MSLLSFHIVYPLVAALVALCAAVALVFWLWRSRGLKLKGARKYAALVGGITLAAGIGLAFGDVRSESQSRKRAVVLLIDCSASTGDTTRPLAERAYADLRSELSPDDYLSVIAFAETPLSLVGLSKVEETPPQLPTPIQGEEGGAEDSGKTWIFGEERRMTSLERALRVAALSFPPGTSGQVVLIGDGQGCQALPGLSVPLSAVYTAPEPLADVAIASMHLNSLSHGPGGERALEVELTAFASQPSKAQVEIRIDGKVAHNEEMQLGPGLSPIPISISELGKQDQILEALIQGEIDEVPGNERLRARIPGIQQAPSILLVDESESYAASAYLQKILRAGPFDVQQISPASMPEDALYYDQFDAIVIVEAAASSLSFKLQRMIANWCRQGGGLAMLGGPQAFAVGGWFKTSIEEALPVLCRVKRSGDDRLAVVIVMDRSGSMGADTGNGTKMDQANRGAELAMRLVMDEDYFGVLSTDTENTWIVPLEPLTNRSSAMEAIRTNEVGGGGILLDTALTEAYEKIREVEAESKFVVLFSDASDTEEKANWDGRAARERALNKIRISTIAIGQQTDPDVEFLERLAKSGDGRAMLTEDATQLPVLFSSEASRMVGGYIREGDFGVVVKQEGYLVDELPLSSAPALRGYIATKPKDNARIWLAPSDGSTHPLLVTGSYGLGRSMAFTSDVRDRWADQWLGENWTGITACWQRWIRWLSDAPGYVGTSDVDVKVEDQSILFTLSHGDLPRGSVHAFIRDDSGSGAEYEMERVGPARSTLRIRSQTPGLVQAKFWFVEGNGERGDAPYPLGESTFVRSAIGESLVSPKDFTRLKRIAESSGGVVAADAREAISGFDAKLAILEPNPWPAALLSMVGVLLMVMSRRFPSVFRKSHRGTTPEESRILELMKVRQSGRPTRAAVNDESFELSSARLLQGIQDSSAAAEDYRKTEESLPFQNQTDLSKLLKVKRDASHPESEEGNGEE